VHKTKVSVTEKDIAEGERGNIRFCPVALAMKVVLPEDWFVRRVNYDFTLIESKLTGKIAYLEHPGYVCENIQVFDSGDGMLPFEFEVQLPEGEMKWKS
jgi:hypothetical protein